MRWISIRVLLAVSSAVVAACATSDHRPVLSAVARPALPAEEKSVSDDGKTLTGRFVLFMRRIGSEQPDSITFKSDGSCLFDVDGRTGVAGVCRTSPDGIFTLTATSSSQPILSGKYQRRKYSLCLYPGEPSELFYVRWPLSPSKPPPPERDVLGKQTASSNLGTIAQELTADHHFMTRGRDLVQEYRAYYDFEMRGTFSYAEGIITYRPSFATTLERVEYLQDFVVDRDDKCLWIVDPMLDNLLCVSGAASLDLDPPPDGWREGPRP